MKWHAKVEHWPMAIPFRITGHLFEKIEVLSLTLEQDDVAGHAEAAGIYYKNDRPASMLEQLHSFAPALASGIDRQSLRTLLPAGGLRNVLDCALWDLEAKLTGKEAWEIAGLPEPHPLLTTFTCGADTPDAMARHARSFRETKAIKIKLTGEPIDHERVAAIRSALPDAWIGVDANQGFSRSSLEAIIPTLVDADVKLIEQPFPVGREGELEGLQSPIPLAADESAQTLADIPRLAGLFDVINIKLDKCGGLTEGLAMARAARAAGFEIMVGNMLGTSLAMAPAFLVGQLARIVDLDGPALLSTDRENGMRYSDGHIVRGDCRWGRPVST